uniref:Uncharacterized protein n=1 Tax=Solanum lycopersicum TaxID=4081 RepID=A0A3Q7HBE3_SOLLC
MKKGGDWERFLFCSDGGVGSVFGSFWWWVWGCRRSGDSSLRFRWLHPKNNGKGRGKRWGFRFRRKDEKW